MTPYQAVEIAECLGSKSPSEEEQIEAWQYLHDTGLAYTLQGWYGRTARSLIEQGVITP